MLTFYFYSFLGWIWECCYVGIRERRLVNRGFIHGPFLPLYGSATVIMLLVGQNLSQNILLLYLASAMGATVLEYATGVTMEALFKVRYWDYSDRPFNYKGQICLGATLLWGFFGVLFIRGIHPTVEHFLLYLAGMAQGNVMKALVYLLTIYFVADFTLSFREAMELRDLLLALEHLQEAVEGKIESTR
ncbi:MAG: putative ABC transporter permease, partial [Lachnospiraceae bacterium]|nr:putative ABC transporter permease [Lachnospiraceae bacterium]